MAKAYAVNKTSAPIIKYVSNGSIDIGFKALSDLVVGQLVKLTTTGVDKITAAGQPIIGVVTVPAKKDSLATIKTSFSSIVRAEVGASAINAGSHVGITAIKTETGRNVVKTSATGEWVTGMALTTAAAANDELEVGIYYNQFKQ